MPVAAIGTAAAVGAKPLGKVFGWLMRGFGKLGRSPLFIDTVQGALSGGASAASTSLGNTGNTQRVGKGGPGSSATTPTGYSSEGGNKNLMLYIAAVVGLLLLMKK